MGACGASKHVPTYTTNRGSHRQRVTTGSWSPFNPGLFHFKLAKSKACFKHLQLVGQRLFERTIINSRSLLLRDGPRRISRVNKRAVRVKTSFRSARGTV